MPGKFVHPRTRRLLFTVVVFVLFLGGLFTYVIYRQKTVPVSPPSVAVASQPRQEAATPTESAESSEETQRTSSPAADALDNLSARLERVLPTRYGHSLVLERYLYSPDELLDKVTIGVLREMSASEKNPALAVLNPDRYSPEEIVHNFEHYILTTPDSVELTRDLMAMKPEIAFAGLGYFPTNATMFLCAVGIAKARAGEVDEGYRHLVAALKLRDAGETPALSEALMRRGIYPSNNAQFSLDCALWSMLDAGLPTKEQQAAIQEILNHRLSPEPLLALYRQHAAWLEQEPLERFGERWRKQTEPELLPVQAMENLGIVAKRGYAEVLREASLFSVTAEAHAVAPGWMDRLRTRNETVRGLRIMVWGADKVESVDSEFEGAVYSRAENITIRLLRALRAELLGRIQWAAAAHLFPAALELKRWKAAHGDYPQDWGEVFGANPPRMTDVDNPIVGQFRYERVEDGFRISAVADFLHPYHLDGAHWGFGKPANTTRPNDIYWIARK